MSYSVVSVHLTSLVNINILACHAPLRIITSSNPSSYNTLQFDTMANLQYYNYPGVGTSNREQFSYSQAVRVGDTIQCSGQGESVVPIPYPKLAVGLS